MVTNWSYYRDRAIFYQGWLYAHYKPHPKIHPVNHRNWMHELGDFMANLELNPNYSARDEIVTDGEWAGRSGTMTGKEVKAILLEHLEEIMPKRLAAHDGKGV